MKTSYIFMAFIAILAYTTIIGKRDKELLKAYDACLQNTQQPNCPDSWKNKPAFR